MSEKLQHSLYLTTGNMLTATTTMTTTPSASGAASSGCTLIGAPTLISSTFNRHNTQALPLLTPTPIASDTSPNAHHNNAGSGSGCSDTESSSEFGSSAIAAVAQLNFHLSPDAGGTVVGGIGSTAMTGDYNSLMNSSQMSAISNDSTQSSSAAAVGAIVTNETTSKSAGNSGSNGGKHLTAQSVAGKSCRFPKLEECAHFHYERVQLGPLSVRLVDDKSEFLNSSIASQSIGGDIANSQSATASAGAGASAGGPSSFRSFSPSHCWFIIKVIPHLSEPFLVKRSFDNMQMLDEMLHRCVYDRKISGLKNLHELEFKTEEDVEYAVAKYLERFSKIASDSLTCGTILTWLQLDNKGRRLPLADGDTMRSINTPAVGAAYGVRRYQAQASDEISIEVGDMISVIDMPSPAESIWWRGKKSHLQKSHYEVGFFPQSCVATIGDKVPRHFPMPAPLVGQLDVSPTKPVLRKHGKLIAFFRSFILSRPSRRRLKQSGIYRERVFSCDLSEHLLNSGQEIPMVLKCCAEFIEEYGIVDGIYRLSGITSNIQRLRRAFDEERIPDLGNTETKQDIHAVSSLLKMYFRELPNPLCTYQLYDNFVEAIQAKSESSDRLRLMKETVLKLPPPHYRTLKYLSQHLNKISQHSARTGMTDKNLAIVWAPNLLRSPALESGGVAALRGVGVQAVVTEYLIRNCYHIFDALEDSNVRLSYIATASATPAASAETRLDSLTDCESLLVEQREHDQSLTFVERPKSLSTGGPKLISLEEAQERHSRVDAGFDMKTSMPINMVTNNAANIGSYIEVGGGPSSLPDKYHTVLSVPRSWQKRKTHSWKSLFMRNQRTVSNGGGGGGGGVGGPHELKSSETRANTAGDGMAHHYKGATHVTFAEADAIISCGNAKVGKSLLKHDKPKSIELFETTRCFGGEMGKPMEMCVRSNSIDSLRTAGHSRSVSHDSYFDLLQSPQRSHITTCPSRELSELGLNFDREEPEMRIFSESESLVSSPRVGKENIPPSYGATSRRIMRARPEEFSSQTNSVNPSPKKQPRLNLLLSPSSATSASHHNTAHWSQSNAVSGVIGSSGVIDNEHVHLSSDESCCKRYKLEDQLSDIQFIDCGTPEHTIGNPQTATTTYTNAQVHTAPEELSMTDGRSKDCSVNTTPLGGKFGKASELSHPNANARYSYPTVQLGAKRKDQENCVDGQKERFSYPGSSVGSDARYSAVRESVAMRIAEEPHHKTKETSKNNRISSFGGGGSGGGVVGCLQKCIGKPPLHQRPPKAELLAADLLHRTAKNRNSYCGTNEQINLLLLRGSSTDIATKDAAKCENVERTKLCVTPSSPVQSPRYSLLVGETSSENSSAVNTPQYDMEPLMMNSTMSCLSGISAATSSNLQQPLLLGVDASSYLGTSHESIGSNLTSNSNITAETRDMHALKRELSLDLNSISTKMVMGDQAEANTTLLTSRQPHMAMQMPSPNNSNFTDNTSQSVTPSEYGYQHLQRQSSMHSLLETEEYSPAYEEYENTPSNNHMVVSSPLSSQKLASPIKATISITYNLKSPTKEESFSRLLRDSPTNSQTRPLLETSFDENIVYEQVKFFRNSVTEVNQLLNESANDATHKNSLSGIVALPSTNLKDIAEVSSESEKEDKRMCDGIKNLSALIKPSRHVTAHKKLENDESDVQMMSDNELTQCAAQEEKLLYENVELRKPQSVYENILGETMKNGSTSGDDDYENNLKHELNDAIATTNCLEQLNNVADAAETEVEVETEEAEVVQLLENITPARKSPSNFSVKELATKFETSPVEQLPAFDFSLRNSMKIKQNNIAIPDAAAKTSSSSHLSLTNEHKKVEKSSVQSTAVNFKQKLTKSQQITRSLDENAFVREFGAKNLHDLTARSTQQLPEYTEVSNRRKSFDFTRPKTLNPPKRLPGMSIAEEICTMQRNSDKPPLKLDFNREKTKMYNNIQQLHNDDCCRQHIEHDCESSELKITPTTENRISLIQNNVSGGGAGAALDLNNSNLTNLTSNSLKVLSGVKLDRERIDRIKEERRQQLTQKYRGESFKSKSKTDLNSTAKEDVKFHTESLRVKSKSRGDVCTLDNLKEFGGGGRLNSVGGSESTLNEQNFSHRVRSISDEKNQNCDHQQQQIRLNNSNLNDTTTTTNTTTASSRATPFGNNALVSSDSSTASDDYQKSTKTTKTKDANNQEEFSARATVQKFERKTLDGGIVGGSNGGGVIGGVGRERSRCDTNAIAVTGNSSNLLNAGRNSLTSTREKISPQFSIRDVTAMFESRSQNQQ